MTEKMKIGVDIDEVVVEFMKHFIEFYKRKVDKKFDLDYESIENYLFEDIFNIDTEDAFVLLDSFSKSNFSKEMPSVEGVKKSINKLKENYDIVFITARPTSVKEETIRDIATHFPKNDFKIIYSYDDERNKIKSKAEFCKEHGISCMIDDSSKVIEECASEGLTCFLFDRPWNRNFNDKKYENIFRVKNWNEIQEKLKELNFINVENAN